MANVVFFDTSVLLPGVVELGPEAKPAQRLFDAVADKTIESPCTAWHCCLEFFSVLTRLPVEVRVSPKDAADLVEQELLARFRVVDLLARHRDEFLASLSADQINGGRIYDAHIAEVARRNGAELLVTENRKHFQTLLRYDIRVISAEEAVDELL